MKGYILVKDASKKRFRVSQMGANHETLNTSEVLNTTDAVQVNIQAAENVFGGNTHDVRYYGKNEAMQAICSKFFAKL
jgi:hypothetical protein